MSQSLCNSLFLHFYIFLQCEDVLNIVSYIVPPYGAKALQVVGVDGMKRQTNTGISPLTGRKPCKFTQNAWGNTYLSFVSVPLRGESLARMEKKLAEIKAAANEYQSPYGAKALQVYQNYFTATILLKYQSPYGAKALQVDFWGDTWVEKKKYQSPYGAKALQDYGNLEFTVGQVEKYQSPYGAKALQV